MAMATMQGANRHISSGPAMRIIVTSLTSVIALYYKLTVTIIKTAIVTDPPPHSYRLFTHILLEVQNHFCFDKQTIIFTIIIMFRKLHDA